MNSILPATADKFCLLIDPPPHPLAGAVICERQAPNAVLYYFENYGMRIEHVFGVDDRQWAWLCSPPVAATDKRSERQLTPFQRNAPKRHEARIRRLIARGAHVNRRLIDATTNHMRGYIRRCLFNRAVVRQFRMALILLHDSESPFRAFDVEGVLVELFGEIFAGAGDEERLPRPVVVEMLTAIVNVEEDALSKILKKG